VAAVVVSIPATSIPSKKNIGIGGFYDQFHASKGVENA
jgi:hypothetical protein